MIQINKNITFCGNYCTKLIKFKDVVFKGVSLLRIKNTKNSPSSAGNRVKSARMLSGHSRKAFADISGISMATLRAWEDPGDGRKGLTKKGADRLVKALNKAGISCSKKWLLHGEGIGPKPIGQYSEIFTDEDVFKGWGEEEAIFKDIESFRANNIDGLIAIVNDDAMLPLYSPGDYVGGIKKTGNDIKNLIGINCIVEYEDSIIIRRITTEKNGLYTLSVLNQDSTLENLVLVDVDISIAAEVTWHRWASRL